MSIAITDQPTPSGNSTSNQATYDGVTGTYNGWGSWTPTNGRMVYVKVTNSKGSLPEAPTLAGNGQTWTSMPGTSIVFDTAAAPTRRVTIFYALIAGASAGRLSVTFSGVNQTGCMIEVIDVTGIDTSGSNGVNSFRNVVTAVQDTADKIPKLTLAAFLTTNNAVVMGTSVSGTDTLTVDALQSGYTGGTGQAFATPNMSGRTQWRLNSDTAPQFTTATNNRWGAIAFELVAAPVLGVVFDAASTSGWGTSSLYSWAHVVGAGANAVLVVTVKYRTTGGVTVTGVTYNGVALTHDEAADVANGDVGISTWYLVAPSTGSNSIEVTLSGISASIGDAASYSNSDQVAPIETRATNTGTGGSLGGTAAVSVTTLGVGSMAVGAFWGTPITSLTPASVQNNREQSVAATDGAALDDIGAVLSPGATAFSWAFIGVTTPWAASAVSLRSADAPYPFTLTVGALALTDAAPTVQVSGGGTSLTPSVGALAFSSNAPALDLAIVLIVGSLTLASAAPAPINSTVLTPNVGALAFTGATPIEDVTRISGVGSLTMVGRTLTLAGASRVAYRGSGEAGDSVGTGDRSCSFLVFQDELLVVFCAVSGNTNATPTCDDNAEQVANYALIETALKGGSTDILSCFVRGTPIQESAIFLTVTVATGANTAGEIVVVAVTGMTRFGASAVRQSVKQQNQSGGTIPAPTFGFPVASVNVTLGAVFDQSNPAALVEPDGWVERQDAGVSAPATGIEVVTRDSGFDGMTVLWGSTSPSAFSDIVIELDASTLLGPSLGQLTLSQIAPLVVVDTILTPAVDSLTLAGVAPLPVVDTMKTPNLGALILTENVSSLDIGKIPDSDALMLTGSVSIVQESGTGSISLTPGVGSFILNGAALTEGLGIRSDAGSLALTGVVSSVVSGIILTPAVGALTLVAVAPSPVLGIPVTLSTGALLLIGNSPSRVQGVVFTPSSGALALVGVTSDLLQYVRFIPIVGVLVLTGIAPTVGGDTQLTPAACVLVLASDLPSVFSDATTTPNVGSLVLAAASSRLDLSIRLVAGSLLTTGNAPIAVVNVQSTPLSGSLDFGSQTSRLDFAIAPSVDSLTFSENAPVAITNTWLTPNVCVLTLAGQLPIVSGPVESTIGVGALTLIGVEPTVIVSPTRLIRRGRAEYESAQRLSTKYTSESRKGLADYESAQRLSAEYASVRHAREILHARSTRSTSLE